MRIYVAADLFTPHARRRNVELGDRLRALGHEVFLPQEIRTSAGERPKRAVIFKDCVGGVDDCDLVVALVDGPDVDSGTAWELGYAYAQKKPIVALRTDYRGAEGGPVNIMVEQSATRLVLSTAPRTGEEPAIEKLLAAVSALEAESSRGVGGAR